MTNSSSEKGRSTYWGASYNFINSIVGAGIIGIPFAFSQCGLLTGVIMLTVVAILVSRSVLMLIQSGIKCNKFNLEDVAEHYLGSIGYYSSLTFMFLFGFGGQVAYLVIIGDTIPVVSEIFFQTGVIDRNIVVIILSVVIILPLCLLRDLSTLSWTSLLSITCDFVLIVILVVCAPTEAKQQHITPEFSIIHPSLFAGVGTLSFAFVCQHNSFLVFKSLAEQTFENWKKVAYISIGFSFVLSLAFGLSGCLSFSESTKGDLLTNFPKSNFPVNVARFLLGITMLFTFPMECYVTRHCIQSILFRLYTKKSNFALLNNSTNEIEINPIHDTSMNKNAFCIEDDEDNGDDEFEHDNFGLEMVVPNKNISTFSILTSKKDYTLQVNVNDDEKEENAKINVNKTQNSSEFGQHNRQAPQTLDNEASGNESEQSPEQSLSLGAHLLLSVLLWGLPLLLATLSADLGAVLSLTGSLAASMVGYVLPPLIHLQAHREQFADAWRQATDGEDLFMHEKDFEESVTSGVNSNGNRHRDRGRMSENSERRERSVGGGGIYKTVKSTNIEINEDEDEDEDISGNENKEKYYEDDDDDDEDVEVIVFNKERNSLKSTFVYSSNNNNSNKSIDNNDGIIQSLNMVKVRKTLLKRIQIISPLFLPVFMIFFGIISMISGVATVLYNLSNNK